MELIHGLHNLRPEHHGCVVVIGKFDGVHLGHRALLRLAREHADALGVPVTVVTFEPSPGEYFGRDQAPLRISTLFDKLSALEAEGVSRLLMARFDARIAQMQAGSFTREILAGKLGARAIIVGDDFRFGQGRDGDRELLERLGQDLGFRLLACPTVLVDGQRVSSTGLREALQVADLERAERLLGRPYRISGRVRHGLKLGRKLGMATANIALRKAMALRIGVYAVVGHFGDTALPGVASLGVRPTLGLERCLLETHLFGDPGSLYGTLLGVEFRQFLRAEVRFDSLDDLKLQMHRDADRARQLLATDPPSELP